MTQTSQDQLFTPWAVHSVNHILSRANSFVYFFLLIKWFISQSNVQMLLSHMPKNTRIGPQPKHLTTTAPQNTQQQI